MRRPLSSLPARVPPDEASGKTSTYQVWLDAQRADEVRETVACSGLSWAKWADKAIDALIASGDEEDVADAVRSWVRGRAGKKSISFRVSTATLVRCQAIAERHGGTVQALFAHAFIRQMAADSFAPLLKYHASQQQD